MLDRYFGISAAGSTIPVELRAGLTTFLTMSYVLFVNPQVLGGAIAIPHGFPKLVVVTALAAAAGSALMGLVARYPFAQAPGMGLNAYFTYTVVLGEKIAWQTALGAVLLSGAAFVVLSVAGARQAIVRAIPEELKLAVTAGIGTFLAFLGLKNAGIVVANPATFVTLGKVTSAPALIAAFGLIVTAAMLVLRVRGAVLIGIIASTVLAALTHAAVYPSAHGLAAFPGFPSGVAAWPMMPTGLWGALDVKDAVSATVISVVFTFFFVAFFDATGTLVGLAERAGAMGPNGDMPRARHTFACDGLAAMIGAVVGTSTTTAYVESASGIAEGGRTGLTACVVAVLFLASTALWPLAGAIPPAATAPALIVVGAMMMSSLGRVVWDDYAIAIPVFLTIVAMPLTFSIANGVSFGIIAYAAIALLSRRARAVNPLLYLVAAVLAARYAWFSG